MMLYHQFSHTFTYLSRGFSNDGLVCVNCVGNRRFEPSNALLSRVAAVEQIFNFVVVHN
jgi:hypothetical protein